MNCLGAWSAAQSPGAAVSPSAPSNPARGSPGFGDLYFAFNAHHFEVRADLPPPRPGCKWCRVVDTNLAAPKDFTPGGNAGVEPSYGVAPHSAIMLLAKQA